MKQPEQERAVMLFYESYEDAINDLYEVAEERQCLELYRAIVRYGLYGEMPEFTGIASTFWKLIYPTLKSGRDKAAAGRAGGKKSKRNNPNGRRGKAAGNDTADPSEGSPMAETETATATPQRKATAPTKQPPTLGNIREYIAVNALNVDAEEFYNYYASQDWEIDGKPIRSVAALLRKWSEKATAATWPDNARSSIFNGL